MTLPARVLTVIREVAQEHGVAVHDILSPCRLRPVAWARHDAMLRVRALAWALGNPPSYPKIGLWFNRHHSTVMHACDAAKFRCRNHTPTRSPPWINSAAGPDSNGMWI